MPGPWSTGFSFGFGPIGKSASIPIDSMQLMARNINTGQSLYWDFSNTQQFYIVIGKQMLLVSSQDAKLFYIISTDTAPTTSWGYQGNTVSNNYANANLNTLT